MYLVWLPLSWLAAHLCIYLQQVNSTTKTNAMMCIIFVPDLVRGVDRFGGQIVVCSVVFVHCCCCCIITCSSSTDPWFVIIQQLPVLYCYVVRCCSCDTIIWLFAVHRCLHVFIIWGWLTALQLLVFRHLIGQSIFLRCTWFFRLIWLNSAENQQSNNKDTFIIASASSYAALSVFWENHPQTSLIHVYLYM